METKPHFDGIAENYLAKTKVEYNTERRISNSFYIERLKNIGYRVEKLNPYCYRINEVLEIYPTERRFILRMRHAKKLFGRIECSFEKFVAEMLPDPDFEMPYWDILE